MTIEVTFFSGWSWKQLFILLLIWIAINVGPMWLFIYKYRTWKRPEAILDPKYRPFSNLDDPLKWSYLIVFFTNFFSIPRQIIGWLGFWVAPIIGVFLSIGVKRGSKYSGWRLALLKKAVNFTCWFPCFIMGIVL